MNNLHELTHFSDSVKSLSTSVHSVNSTHPQSLCSTAINSVKSFHSFQAEKETAASVPTVSRTCFHVKFSICKQQNPCWTVKAERDLLKDIGWLPEFVAGMENQV